MTKARVVWFRHIFDTAPNTGTSVVGNIKNILVGSLRIAGNTWTTETQGSSDTLLHGSRDGKVPFLEGGHSQKRKEAARICEVWHSSLDSFNER